MTDQQTTYDKVIQVRIAENVWATIEAEAKRLNIKTPDVIRLALGEYVANARRAEAVLA